MSTFPDPVCPRRVFMVDQLGLVEEIPRGQHRFPRPVPSLTAVAVHPYTDDAAGAVLSCPHCAGQFTATTTATVTLSPIQLQPLSVVWHDHPRGPGGAVSYCMECDPRNAVYCTVCHEPGADHDEDDCPDLIPELDGAPG